METKQGSTYQHNHHITLGASATSKEITVKNIRKKRFSTDAVPVVKTIDVSCGSTFYVNLPAKAVIKPEIKADNKTEEKKNVNATAKDDFWSGSGKVTNDKKTTSTQSKDDFWSGSGKTTNDKKGEDDFWSSSKTTVQKETNKDTVLIDPRDGQHYKIIDIGGLTWMAENIKYRELATEETYYKNWCFYNFENANKVCPAGWRLPNTDDLMKLAKEKIIKPITMPDYIPLEELFPVKDEYNNALKKCFPRWRGSNIYLEMANSFFRSGEGEDYEANFWISEGKTFKATYINDGYPFKSGGGFWVEKYTPISEKFRDGDHFWFQVRCVKD